MSLQAPRQLQQLEVPLISRETCNCLYNIDAKPNEPHSIQQDMVCAGYVEGGKDACQVNAGRGFRGTHETRAPWELRAGMGDSRPGAWS